MGSTVFLEQGYREFYATARHDLPQKKKPLELP